MQIVININIEERKLSVESANMSGCPCLYRLLPTAAFVIILASASAKLKTAVGRYLEPFHMDDS